MRFSLASQVKITSHQAVITGTGSVFGMAISGYRDQGAIAVGIQKSLTPDTSVNLKAAWDSGNGVGVATGYSVNGFLQ